MFDLVNEKALVVYTTKALVVDEADLMLDMGFLEDVDRLASNMPEKLQMLVFSATIPEKLKPFLKNTWKIQNLRMFRRSKQQQLN